MHQLISDTNKQLPDHPKYNGIVDGKIGGMWRSLRGRLLRRDFRDGTARLLEASPGKTFKLSLIHI